MNRFSLFVGVMTTAATVTSATPALANWKDTVASLEAQVAVLTAQNAGLTDQNATLSAKVADDQQQISALAVQVGACQSQDQADAGALSLCAGSLSSCSDTVASGSNNLAACSDNLSICSTNLSNCSGNLSGCQASVPATGTITACGTVITQPGTYTLAADLNCSGATGIDIEASHVTVRLAGHTIATGGTAILVGASASISDAAIYGPGKVTGSANSSVLLIQAANSIVAGVVATGNRVGFANIGNASATGNQIIGNEFWGNQQGMQVLGGANSEYAFNKLHDNQEGMWIGGEIQYNQITTGNSVHDNAMTKNSIGMRAFPGGTGNTMTANVSQGNFDWDIGDHNACGVNTWSGNTFTKSFLSCLR